MAHSFGSGPVVFWLFILLWARVAHSYKQSYVQVNIPVNMDINSISVLWSTILLYIVAKENSWPCQLCLPTSEMSLIIPQKAEKMKIIQFDLKKHTSSDLNTLEKHGISTGYTYWWCVCDQTQLYKSTHFIHRWIKMTKYIQRGNWQWRGAQFSSHDRMERALWRRCFTFTS